LPLPIQRLPNFLDILKKDVLSLNYSETDMQNLIVKLCESEIFAVPVFVLDLNRHLLSCLEQGNGVQRGRRREEGRRGRRGKRGSRGGRGVIFPKFL
jgi:hypothetical protein